MNEEELRKRNARAKQNQKKARSKVSEHEEFDNIGLTKRNAEYMYKFKLTLAKTKLEPEKQADAIKQMVTELQKAQKKGITARTLFGPIKDKVETVVNPPKSQKEMTKQTYIIDSIYNFLWFMVLFCFLYAAVFFISPKEAANGGVMGITGIVVSSIVAGLGMPIMTNLFAPGVKHHFNGWIRFLFMILLFAFWILVFFASVYIPRPINPITSPIFDAVLGVLALCGVLYMRSKYPITNGLFMGSAKAKK